MSTQSELKTIIKILSSGGVIAFPTETVFALGADITQVKAIEKIYSLKGRAFNKPLSMFVSSQDMLEEYVCDITPLARLLIKKYWPGPLTLVFKAQKKVSRSLCSGETIGVRMSSHPLVSHILKEFKKPLTATSANVSGFPSARTYQEVLHYFSDVIPAIDYVVKSHLQGATLESTVVDVTGLEGRILREGALNVKTHIF